MQCPIIAVYSRKSRFTGQGESIENQIELCRKYCLGHYEGLRAEDLLLYEDEGFSGGNTRRPQFLAMMEDARRRRFDVIVCYRLDRVSRNIGDFARLIEELGSLSIAFVSIKEQFDTSSPLGRAMMYIASVFSQLERETIAERIRDNMLELSRTGRWLGGVTPTGFASQMVAYQGEDGKTRRLCRLTPVPEEIDLVRRVYRGFLACGSITLLEERLRGEGILSRRGRPLRRDALRQMLVNPVYAAADENTYRYFETRGAQCSGQKEDYDGARGLMVYNKTRQEKGRRVQIRPCEEWIVAPGEHPAVLPGEMWLRVQRLLSAPPRGRPTSRENAPPLLSGILFCAGCGSPLRAKKTGRRDQAGRDVFYYLCREKERSGGCTVKNAPGQALDEAVWHRVVQIAEDPAALISYLLAARAKARAQLDRASHPGPPGRGVSGAPLAPPGGVCNLSTAHKAGGVLPLRGESPCPSGATGRERESKTPDAAPPALVSHFPLLSLSGWGARLSPLERREAMQTLFSRAQWDGERLTLFPAGMLPSRGDSK
ncbi:recombinase family protein [Zongyangia hominis]|uniref:Recombinase family protein n=1 Tax=Zongyangia hominis TaxID=2763677 RepID=A0A926EEL2_9FIRM|nr:recombinase family protein [Zongyangia hominis]MBC8570744.1 recombinase family protein [Zongyangia hominis]